MLIFAIDPFASCDWLELPRRDQAGKCGICDDDDHETRWHTGGFLLDELQLVFD